MCENCQHPPYQRAWTIDLDGHDIDLAHAAGGEILAEFRARHGNPRGRDLPLQSTGSSVVKKKEDK
jgi:hypothetical protein